MPLKVDAELSGQRVTSQRKLLLDIVNEAGGHLDADELYRRAKAKEPRISLSTVYRNLRLFKDLGLVAERHFTEEHHHYEVRDSAEHHHLVCLGCGEVLEFQCPLTEKMKRDLEEESQYKVTDIEVSMEGYCPKCQKNNEVS